MELPRSAQQRGKVVQDPLMDPLRSLSHTESTGIGGKRPKKRCWSVGLQIFRDKHDMR